MKFVTKKNCFNPLERFTAAISFLRHAYMNNEIGEIVNMDELLEALDVSQDLEYLMNVLDSNHISY